MPQEAKINLFLMINVTVRVKLRQLYGENQAPSAARGRGWVDEGQRSQPPSQPVPGAPRDEAYSTLSPHVLSSCHRPALWRWAQAQRWPSKRTEVRKKGRCTPQCGDLSSHSDSVSGCVILAECSNLSELQSPHLRNGHINNIQGFLWRTA